MVTVKTANVFVTTVTLVLDANYKIFVAITIAQVMVIVDQELENVSVILVIRVITAKNTTYAVTNIAMAKVLVTKYQVTVFVNHADQVPLVNLLIHVVTWIAVITDIVLTGNASVIIASVAKAVKLKICAAMNNVMDTVPALTTLVFATVTNVTAEILVMYTIAAAT